MSLSSSRLRRVGASFRNSTPSRMRESGVRSSCEALASSSLCDADQLLDPRGGAVEALRQPRHLVLALDLHARGEIAGAELLDAGLQSLQPAREPADQRIGADRHRQRDRPEKADDARTAAARCRTGMRATTQRSSGKRERPTPVLPAPSPSRRHARGARQRTADGGKRFAGPCRTAPMSIFRRSMQAVDGLLLRQWRRARPAAAARRPFRPPARTAADRRAPAWARSAT